MKKSDYLVLIILLISPVLINYIILGTSVGATVNGSTDGWLGFYGTLVGSFITMFILYRTRVWNKEDNEDTRNTQNKILKYQAKLVWLEGLRKQLDSNYRILNFQGTIIAANNIAAGNCQIATDFLLNLNKEIEMQGYSFDLYLSGDKLNDCETEYISCYQHILKQYGDFVNDLLLISGIRTRISQGGDITSYIKDSINHFNEINKTNPNVTPSVFLQILGSKFNSEYTFEDLENICTSRILGISFIHSEKIKLQQVTNELLKYEEKAIQDILI